MALVKIAEKRQPALPAKIEARHDFAVGDYADVRKDGKRVELVGGEEPMHGND